MLHIIFIYDKIFVTWHSSRRPSKYFTKYRAHNTSVLL